MTIDDLLYTFEHTTTEGDADILLARKIIRGYPEYLKRAFMCSTVFEKWTKKNAKRVEAFSEAEKKAKHEAEKFNLTEDERMQVAIAFGSFDKYPNPPKDRAGTTKLPDYMVNRNAYTPITDKIDPVVRQMYQSLLYANQLHPGMNGVQTAIDAALKHFNGLTAVTLAIKEQMVDETFPGIYRETRNARHIYTIEEWTAMINVLYIKALDSRRKNEVTVRAEVPAGAGEPVKGTRIVQGNIAPIEAAFLKNLGK